MQSFGFGNTDIKVQSFDKFAGEKNKSYVVAIAHHPKDEYFLGGKQHFSNRASKGWACLSTETNKAVCCTHDYDGNDAKWRIGCVIVVYKVADDGVTISGVEKVLPWLFNDVRYQQLNKLAKIHGNVDMDITCKDTKFQSFDIMPRKECVWRMDPKAVAFVEAASRKAYETLPKMLAKKISEAEIREILGINGGSAADSAAGLNLSGIAENL